MPKVAGAAVQGSLGIGGFLDNNRRPTVAAFNTTGAAANAGNCAADSPSQNSLGVLLGSISRGVSRFLTNAQSKRQLSGPFTTRTLDVGVGPYQVSVSLSTGGGIWQLSFNPPWRGPHFRRFAFHDYYYNNGFWYRLLLNYGILMRLYFMN